MKPALVISSLVVPLILSACDDKKSESTKVEMDSKDVPAETVKIEETAADANSADKMSIEVESGGGKVSGALIGAEAGGVIGHQSGAALEGAAIGAAAGEIDFKPDEVEEE